MAIAPIQLTFRGRLGGMTNGFTTTLYKDGSTVTNPTVTMTGTPYQNYGTNYYMATFTPDDETATWFLQALYTTGELWEWHVNQETAGSSLDERATLTGQNNYKITADADRPAYTIRLDADSITKARVYLPYQIEALDYCVIVAVEGETRPDTSVQKTNEYFDVYADRDATLQATLIDLTKLEIDVLQGMRKARRIGVT